MTSFQMQARFIKDFLRVHHNMHKHAMPHTSYPPFSIQQHYLRESQHDKNTTIFNELIDDII